MDTFTTPQLQLIRTLCNNREKIVVESGERMYKYIPQSVALQIEIALLNATEQVVELVTFAVLLSRRSNRFTPSRPYRFNDVVLNKLLCIQLLVNFCCTTNDKTYCYACIPHTFLRVDCIEYDFTSKDSRLGAFELPKVVDLASFDVFPNFIEIFDKCADYHVSFQIKSFIDNSHQDYQGDLKGREIFLHQLDVLAHEIEQTPRLRLHSISNPTMAKIDCILFLHVSETRG